MYQWDLRVLLRLKSAEVDVAAVELAALFETTNPAELTRKITAIQTCLIALAKDKTNAVTANGSRAKPAEARNQLSRAS
ncbi:MAG TPA: hypothetical protein VFD20_00965 [Demequina sp.]|nr:hypothetical protein [Demequina sp.]